VSFSLAASGSRDAVVAQLKAHLKNKDTSDPRANALREKVTQLLIDTIGEDPATPAGADYEFNYYVTGSGHSGGGFGTSLNISITPHYVPQTHTAPQEATHGHQG
jgi:hypothetical protein